MLVAPTLREIADKKQMRVKVKMLTIIDINIMYSKV